MNVSGIPQFYINLSGIPWFYLNLSGIQIQIILLLYEPNCPIVPILICIT